MKLQHYLSLGLGVVGAVLAYVSAHGVDLPAWVSTLTLAANGVAALFITAPQNTQAVAAAKDGAK